MPRSLTGIPKVALAAAALIAVQLVIRAVLAFRGYFYWDDLILVGRAGTHGLLSPSYLFDDHDGHVMPAAFLVAGAITRLAPLNWIGPAISLLVLQLLASLALLRALHVILGWRPVLLIPLTFALFTPLGVPGFAWWAAALNSLPMLAALAWVCADAIMLVRTRNQRYAVTGVLVYLGGLLFFEKAAVIPFVAFAIAALLCHVQGDRAAPAAFSAVWRAGIRLWTVSLALTAAWIAVYRGRGQPAAVEFGSADDVGSAASLGHSRDRSRFGRRTVGLGPLGTGLAVGYPAAGGQGARLAGAGRGAGGLAGPQTAHCPGVADRGRIRGRLPGADLSDALIAVHRSRTGPDVAIFPRSRRGAGAAGRGRVLRTEPSVVTLAGRVRGPRGGDDRGGGVVRGQQLVFDGDVSDLLAGQPRPALSAECPPWFGRRARGLECAAAGSRGRSAGAWLGWPGRRTWPATCSRCCETARNSLRRQRNCEYWTAQADWPTRK